MFSLFRKRKNIENRGWEGSEPTEIVTESYMKGYIRTGDKVLDIGCGFGRNANWLASKGVEVTAINIDKNEIKIAKEKAEKLNLKVNYMFGNAINLQFPDNSFKVALDLGCTHMIYDKNNQKKAEAEVFRVLEPGGILIYFGFSKKHPDYLNKPNSPMFRDVEDIMALYGDDFDLLFAEEERWKAGPKEKGKSFEHIGLNMVLKKKNSL